MKALFSLILSIFSINAISATPPANIINSCIKTQSNSGATYRNIHPDNFTQEEEEDEERTISSTTFSHRHKKIGIWEIKKTNEFGLVYGNENIQLTEVNLLGDQAPNAFNPLTAQWGEVRSSDSKYLCITFNFEGLGESGSFQNIRPIYLIDIKNSPPKFYYTVGDIRAIKK